MFVYIAFEGSVKRSAPVSLRDSLKPTVGTFTEDRIEPALWFKILLLDSVFIDCERRKVFISYDQEAGSTNELHDCPLEKVLEYFKDKEQLFEDSVFYDFDPTIDELFDTTIGVFSSLSIEVFDKKGNSETYENILKIIHLFILPEIRLLEKNVEALMRVQSDIEKDHEKIEDLIQKKDKTKRNTENSLSKQRQSLLLSGDFTSSKHISSLDDNFLMLFLQHLDKDIRKLNEILIRQDAQVRSLRDSTSVEEKDLLASCRSERSEINSALERSIVAREEIKNVISRAHVKKKFKKNKQGVADFHLLYVEVSHRLDIIDSEIRNLIMAKIKLSGVREAILLTLREIETDGESYGFNRKKGSFEMEADLFDPSKKPDEWATMTERVKTYLQVKQLGFRSQFESFCSRMNLKCQQLYDESKLFGATPLSPSTAQFVDMLGSEAYERRKSNESNGRQTQVTGVIDDVNVPFRNSFTLSRSRGYSARWSTGCISRQKCELICQEIIDHINKMALDLAFEMNGSGNSIPRTYVNKLYVCYEEHVSAELLPLLCELYERSYQEQCESLASWIAKHAYSEIGYENKMVNGLLQSRMNDSRLDYKLADKGETEVKRPVVDSELCSSSPVLEETKVKHPVGSTDTLGSVDIKDLSLDDLYLRFNRQGNEVPPSFAGALDIMDYHDDFFNMPEATGSSRKSVNSKASSSSGEDGPIGCVSLPPPYEEISSERNEASFDPPPYSTLPPEKESFYKSFDQFFTLVKEEERACTLFAKLRHMTHINKYIERQITSLREKKGENSITCTDDILDVIILLLCRLESPWLLKLYAHLNLMIHLSPSFMQGNAHDYSLVNFSVAFQHLFEKQVLHRSSR
ncbi:hypothetical protein ACF0H5_022105 [Mactra antiquata]